MGIQTQETKRVEVPADIVYKMIASLNHTVRVIHSVPESDRNDADNDLERRCLAFQDKCQSVLENVGCVCKDLANGKCVCNDIMASMDLSEEDCSLAEIMMSSRISFARDRRQGTTEGTDLYVNLTGEINRHEDVWRQVKVF